MQNAFVSANTDSNALVRSMRLRKRENVKTTIKRKREKKNREKGAKRERERGENRERRNFGTRNWRQSVGWLNRGVEGREPLYAHEEEGPGAPSPHTTLLHGTSEFSSAFVSLSLL